MERGGEDTAHTSTYISREGKTDGPRERGKKKLGSDGMEKNVLVRNKKQLLPAQVGSRGSVFLDSHY